MLPFAWSDSPNQAAFAKYHRILKQGPAISVRLALNFRRILRLGLQLLQMRQLSFVSAQYNNLVSVVYLPYFIIQKNVVDSLSHYSMRMELRYRLFHRWLQVQRLACWPKKRISKHGFSEEDVMVSFEWRFTLLLIPFCISQHSTNTERWIQSRTGSPGVSSVWVTCSSGFQSFLPQVGRYCL